MRVRGRQGSCTPWPPAAAWHDPFSTSLALQRWEIPHGEGSLVFSRNHQVSRSVCPQALSLAHSTSVLCFLLMYQLWLDSRHHCTSLLFSLQSSFLHCTFHTEAFPSSTSPNGVTSSAHFLQKFFLLFLLSAGEDETPDRSNSCLVVTSCSFLKDASLHLCLLDDLSNRRKV